MRTSTQQRAMGPRDPQLSSPAERERSAAKDKGTGGQYVAVCSVSNSPLTHNPFTTLLQPFRIKCEGYIFLKKGVRSSLLLILFPHIYDCDYATIICLYGVVLCCYLKRLSFSLEISLSQLPTCLLVCNLDNLYQ